MTDYRKKYVLRLELASEIPSSLENIQQSITDLIAFFNDPIIDSDGRYPDGYRRLWRQSCLESAIGEAFRLAYFSEGSDVKIELDKVT